MYIWIFTLKNVIVDPPSKVPYWISVWSAKSAALSIGVIIRSTVKNAAKFAVYDEIMIKQKKNQQPPTMRVDVAWNITKGQDITYAQLTVWFERFELLCYPNVDVPERQLLMSTLQ